MHYYITKHLKAKYPPSIYKYFQQVEKKCKRHNVCFKPSLCNHITLYDDGDTGLLNGMRVGGYFCGDAKELGIALRADELSSVLGILLHEESHMEQWLDKTSLWYNKERRKRAGIFWDWMEGARNRTKNIDECNLAVVDLEVDCERRTVVKCKKYFSDLIDIDDYKKHANSYFYFLRHLVKTRQWSELSPLEIPELVEACPSRFKKSYVEIPKKIRKILDEYYEDVTVK